MNGDAILGIVEVVGVLLLFGMTVTAIIAAWRQYRKGKKKDNHNII